MTQRHDFKLAISQRVKDELLDGVLLVLPDFDTSVAKGAKEWVRLRIFHNTTARITIGGKGSRRFNRLGRITLQIFTEANMGPKRADLIAESIVRMFEGRALEGFSVNFDNCEPREVGLDQDGRYNVTLAEINFRYRVRI